MTCHDQLDRVESIMKTREDNNITDRTSVVYIKNDTELLWPIRPGVDCNEN